MKKEAMNLKEIKECVRRLGGKKGITNKRKKIIKTYPINK